MSNQPVRVLFTGGGSGGNPPNRDGGAGGSGLVLIAYDI